MNGSVHIVDHSVFKNLSPLAQATAIVLERRGMVRIVRDEEEEDEREGVNPARVLRSQTRPAKFTLHPAVLSHYSYRGCVKQLCAPINTFLRRVPALVAHLMFRTVRAANLERA